MAERVIQSKLIEAGDWRKKNPLFGREVNYSSIGHGDTPDDTSLNALRHQFINPLSAPNSITSEARTAILQVRQEFARNYSTQQSAQAEQVGALALVKSDSKLETTSLNSDQHRGSIRKDFLSSLPRIFQVAIRGALTAFKSRDRLALNVVKQSA